MELRYYQTASGRRPFTAWLAGLKHGDARARIEARLNQVANGSFGDAKPVGDGVLELRVHWGPGYRVYFARVGEFVLLLLCGGDKRSQDEDIKQAKRNFQDFKRRQGQTRDKR